MKVAIARAAGPPGVRRPEPLLLLDLRISSPRQGQKAEDGEPQQIPEQLVFNIHPDPVNPEYPIEKDTVEDMPSTETDQYICEKQLVCSVDSGTTRAPQQPKRRRCHQVH